MKTIESPRDAGPSAPPSQSQPPGRVPSSKIRSAHLGKLAVVYIRQSSPQQVLENRESTARNTRSPSMPWHSASPGIRIDHRRRPGQEWSHGRRT